MPVATDPLREYMRIVRAINHHKLQLAALRNVSSRADGSLRHAEHEMRRRLIHEEMDLLSDEGERYLRMLRDRQLA